MRQGNEEIRKKLARVREIKDKYEMLYISKTIN